MHLCRVNYMKQYHYLLIGNRKTKNFYVNEYLFPPNCIFITRKKPHCRVITKTLTSLGVPSCTLMADKNKTGL